MNEQQNLEITSDTEITAVETPIEEVNPETATPVQDTEAETAENAALTPESVAKLIEEAEERGYLRGRNESVDALMERAVTSQPPNEAYDDEDDPVMILKEMRRSVWD